jgi:ligand-binding SRPBCC domain-containing protein
MAPTGERAIAGVTSGLIGAGERVRWRGRHFGIWHEHESLIDVFDPPRRFRDVMVDGRFAMFSHDHLFEPQAGGTLMRDVLELRSPGGPLGRVVDALILHRYLSRLLERRNRAIKEAAEGATAGSR